MENCGAGWGKEKECDFWYIDQELIYNLQECSTEAQYGCESPDCACLGDKLPLDARRDAAADYKCIWRNLKFQFAAQMSPNGADSSRDL